MDRLSSSLPPLYDHLFSPISDEDFKLFYSTDRRLYAKLINLLGRDPTESMQIMAFFQWLEVVGKDWSFMRKIYDFPFPLLNVAAEEALTCLKCVEDDNFSTENVSQEIFLIPKLLNPKFTLKYIHENRASAIRGVTKFFKTVCLRAFDDIVQHPKYFTRENLVSPNVLEEIGSSSRMVPIINPSHVPSHVGGVFLESMHSQENKEKMGINSTRMMPILKPSHVPSGGGIFVEPMHSENIEEIGRATNRMVPINPNSHVPSGSGVVLGLPLLVPTNQIQYMPQPFLGGNLNLPNYGLFSHVNASNIGSGIHQMLPNYHHEFGAHEEGTPPAMHKDIAELLKNSLKIHAEEEKEVPPDARTVFLTFSKGYPITETEVVEFFTRKFGEDVEAIYMQEVSDDEQPLYARLVTRSLAALEAIVDGGKAKYNINGKHVWARKYVKKPNPKNQLSQFELYEGQTSSPVASTSEFS
ncbi:uncharacterized protein [Nicotiana tomentosiformis]|nr:uncharacterized protein LOC104099388 [Nicotiana tomentosiformis]